MNAGLRRLRQAPFQISIEGIDRLELACDDVVMEGADTSLQIHLRVSPSQFAVMHHAAQIATAPVLAIAGNSPLLFGNSRRDSPTAHREISDDSVRCMREAPVKAIEAGA